LYQRQSEIHIIWRTPIGGEHRETVRRHLVIVHNIPYPGDKKESPMPKAMTLNVRVSGALGEFVAANVGDVGTYENVSEYVRDLIRRDKERVEADRLAILRAELKAAFAAPESAYEALDADTVIKRNARA
jgi:Arc/MetJ-type ribon-helix-helix transcriptional regulator